MSVAQPRLLSITREINPEEDEFDLMEDEFDYASIPDEQWNLMQGLPAQSNNARDTELITTLPATDLVPDAPLSNMSSTNDNSEPVQQEEHPATQTEPPLVVGNSRLRADSTGISSSQQLYDDFDMDDSFFEEIDRIAAAASTRGLSRESASVGIPAGEFL